jgi:hypothetical protein
MSDHCFKFLILYIIYIQVEKLYRNYELQLTQFSSSEQDEILGGASATAEGLNG